MAPWGPGGEGWESKSLLRSGTGRGADWGCRGLSRRFGLRGWGPVWLPRGEWASSWGYGGAWLLSGRLRGDLGEIRSCAGAAAETTEPAHPGQGTGALKERAAGSGGGHGRKGLRPQLGAVSAVDGDPGPRSRALGELGREAVPAGRGLRCPPGANSLRSAGPGPGSSGPGPPVSGRPCVDPREEPQEVWE